MAKDFNQADADFVTGMIQHHNMAIDMGMPYIKEGQNTEILQWAMDIVTGQMNEIMKKKLWLQERNIEFDDSEEAAEMAKKKKKDMGGMKM